MSIVQNACPDRVESQNILLANSDAFSEHYNRQYPRVIIGGNSLRGEGAGRDPEKGKRAVDESWPEILKRVNRFKHITIVAGAAGGTGACP